MYIYAKKYIYSNLQDEGQQLKWIDGGMFDDTNFPNHSFVSIMPMMNFHCSAERECSEAAVINTSASLLRGEGKCSALLTREGFLILSSPGHHVKSRPLLH